jgi:hypothetical protein
MRSKNFREFQPQGDQASRLEYQPWTSAPGPRGLRTLLLRQFNVTLEKAVPLAGIKIMFNDVFLLSGDISNNCG